MLGNREQQIYIYTHQIIYKENGIIYYFWKDGN